MAEWISIVPRSMPDSRQWVWVAEWLEFDNEIGDYVTCPRVTLGYVDKDGTWWDEWDKGSDGKPARLAGATHWMPFEIPEPPEDCGP